MPRKARIDAPGALHHIIGRGLARTAIFRDDTDYENFILRLGWLLTESATPCLARALMANHAHLLAPFRWQGRQARMAHEGFVTDFTS